MMEELKLFEIMTKRNLNAEVVLFEVKAPRIARKAKPGQFIMFRLDEEGERVPLTIAASDQERGSITIIFQSVGRSTIELGRLEEGEEILDVAGPLGKATNLDLLKGKRVAVIGGGLGAAIAYPQAKYLHDIGAEIDLIVGFRNKDIIILEEEMRAASTNLYITTDDGSNGVKGFVTTLLQERIDAGEAYDHVFAVGPMIMMKAVAELTRPYGISTTVSMNTIMVDGTGMCGSCRLTVGGDVRFACVDGPDFDGHLVDFDEAMNRARIYQKREQRHKEHICNLTGEKR